MRDMGYICHVMKYEFIELCKRIPSLPLVAVVVGPYKLKTVADQSQAKGKKKKKKKKLFLMEAHDFK